jgi:dynamin 1-like protein
MRVHMHACTHKRSCTDEVRDEIGEETDRHLKKFSNRVVSGDPIYLTVYSPNVPNLSLVDMPGAFGCVCLCVRMCAFACV